MLKAITLQQPWAWAVVKGFKKIENRSWKTKWRGLLLIHAGKSRRWLASDGQYLVSEEPIPPVDELAFGAIVGAVQLVDCVPKSKVRGDPHARGPFCWLLSNAIEIEPIPCSGRQGLWTRPRHGLVRMPARLCEMACN